MKKYLIFAILTIFFNIAFPQTTIYTDAKTQYSVNDSISVCKNVQLNGGFALESNLIKLVKTDFENGIPSGWSTINGSVTNTLCTSIDSPAVNNVLWFYQSSGSAGLLTDPISKPFKIKFDIKLSDTSNGCSNPTSSIVALNLDNAGVASYSSTNAAYKQWSSVYKSISQSSIENDTIKVVKWLSVYQNQPSNWALDNVEVYSYINADSVRWYCIEDATWTSNLKKPLYFIPNENIPIQRYVACHYYNSFTYLDTVTVYIINAYTPIITSIDGEDSVCFKSTHTYTINSPNTSYYIWYSPTHDTTVSNTNTFLMNSVNELKVRCFNSCGSTFLIKSIYQFNKTENEDICYVEYDPVTSKNKINWKYGLKPIDSIYIERQISANTWINVGKSLYSNLYFIDNDTINPQSMAYSYRIRAHNLCDSIGSSTSPHKTISLIKSYVDSTTCGFQWTKYQGISPTTINLYNLYGIKSTGDVSLIASLPATSDEVYQYNYITTNNQYVKFYVGFDLSSCSSTKSSLYTVRSNYVSLPIAPVLVSPSNYSQNLAIPVTLQWDSINNVLGYEYQISINSNFTNSIIGNTTQLTVPVASLMYGTIYYWRIRAINGVSPLPWSTVWTFTTQANIDSPQLQSPTDNSMSQPLNLTLNWNSVINATSYEYQYSTNIGFNPSISGTVNNSYVDINGLNSNTSYYWRVKSVNGSNVSDWSDIWTFNTMLVLNPPILTYPVNNAMDIPINVTLNWDSASYEFHYEYQYSTDAFFNNSPIFTTSVSEAQLSNLIYNTNYYWRVRSFSNSISSTWSTTYHFITINDVGVQNNKSESVIIYPTPVSYILNIEFITNDIKSVEIYNILGQLQYHSDVVSKKTQIDVSEFTKGIYLLNVILYDKTVTYRFIVK